jgi:hypothetical protein
MSIDTFTVDAKTGKATIVKDPNAVLDYTFDWTAWIDLVGDVIVADDPAVTSGVSPASNIAVDSSSIVGKTVVVWVSGGAVGETATLRCRITTSGGRIDDRSVFLKIKER